MSKWKEYKIEDIAEILNHKRIPLSSIERAKRKGIYPYYGASGIIDYVDNFIFEGEYVLISEDGENLRTRNTPIAFIAKGNFWVNNHAHILKGKKCFYNKLIAYYLQNLDLNPFLTGAVQPKLNKAALLSIPFLLPSNENEQQAIASTLSSLDDKIDLIHRQNQTLEKIAETLFRKMFVEQPKKDWKYTTLSNYVKIYNGVSYKSTDLNPSETAMITLKSFAREGGFRLDGFKEYTGKFKKQHIVYPGDLVVAHTDITQDATLIGNPVMVIGRSEYMTLVISMDLVKVEPTKNWMTKEFLYFLMRTRLFKEHCVAYSNGSTVLHLNKDAVPSFEFFLPTHELILEYTSIIQPMITKINQNILHIRNLQKLRDTLLPKLMNGDVRINLDS